MKLLFIIQGEGRGHLTQAISLWQQIKGTEHEVLGFMIGSKNEAAHRNFLKGSEVPPLYFFDSPNLVYNKQNSRLSLTNTLSKNLKSLGSHQKGLMTIHKTCQRLQPDLIVNFYDFLAGVYQLFYRRYAPKMICVGHQYLLLHRDFKFPRHKFIDRFLINFNTRITAIGAIKMMALSFQGVPSSGKIVSVPPLLREEVKIQEIGNYQYFVAYLTSAGLLNELLEWHKAHSDKELHCFVQRSQDEEVEQLHKNFFVHRPDAQKFLKLMANCQALVTTAGFESVCEAAYFGKPVMMVPVPNHFEQSCNAFDAASSGIGLAENHFNLDSFLHFLNDFESPMAKFQGWINNNRHLIIQEMESVWSKPSVATN